MTTNLDTLLTALYVLIDDHVIPSGPRRPGRPGRPKRLTDPELVCLAVAQVLLGARSEYHWLRMCYARLGHLFPYLPKQPGYHKRLKAAAPLICQTMTYLATQCPAESHQALNEGADGGPGKTLTRSSGARSAPRIGHPRSQNRTIRTGSDTYGRSSDC